MSIVGNEMETMEKFLKATVNVRISVIGEDYGSPNSESLFS